MVTLDNTFNRDPWILHLDNSLEFAIGNSKTQPPLKCSLLAQWGSGIEFLISTYSCNVLTICHSLTRPGLNLNSEFWSSNHVCFLPWWVLTVANHSSCREFTSILPVSLYLGHWFAVTDGRMPGISESHKQHISISYWCVCCWLQQTKCLKKTS